MAKYYSGITTGTTLDSMLAGGSEFGIFPSQDIDCANINASGIHTVTGFLYPDGGIKDSSDSTGSSGKVLSSTGSGLSWIDPSTGSTANAVNVGTNLNSTNSDQFVAFMGASSGNNPIRVDAGVKYNPSTNLLKVGNVELPNLGEFTLGNSQELKMFHKDDTSDVRVEIDSSTNYILLTKTFDLKNAAGSKAAITATNPGGVPEVLLYHDGNERLKTTNDGVTITGDLTVADIIANGNIDLGSDTNDTITMSGLVDSDIVPSGTTRDLGGNSNRWRNLYATTIKDKDNQSGTSGQVLSSTGTELDWINLGDLAAGSASQIAVTGVSDQTLTYVVLTGNNTGNQSPRSNTSLTFNSTNGTLSATTFSGSGASLTNIPSGQLSGALPAIDGSNLTGLSDNDTTYDLLAVQTSGNNNDPAIKLDASSGDDDEIQIVGGTNVTVTRNSNSQITISSTDTNTNTQLSTEAVQDIVGGMVTSNTESGITVTYDDAGTDTGKLNFSVGTLNQDTTGIADKAETARIVTDSSSAIRPILFIASSGSDNSAVNNTFASLKFSPTIYSLSYNPNTEVFYVNQAQLNKIRVSSGGVGNAGQVLTTGGSGSNMTWEYPFPSGGIIIWSGAASAIPTGWVLCDGTNSTPDLRDKFVVGASNSTGDTTYPGLSVGATGGAATDTVNISDSASVSFGANGTGTASKAGSSSATVSISDSDTVNTLPPYYALCYIMKT